MFRRLSSSLPKDPEFPADLEKLGLFINEKDQIRQIKNPDLEFHYFISKNDRVLEVHREAMDTCARRELEPRFKALGLNITRLPLNTPQSEPHVPILTSPNIATANRLIIYFGESMQDLGVLAYRILGQESIASGSALDFVHDIQSGKDGANTAIVIANLGQLIWYRRGQRALTLKSWNSLPRKTGVSPPMKIDPVKNHIPGNHDGKEHVESVFEAVAKLAKADVKINVIGLSEGAEYAVQYLDRNWERWEKKVQAIAVGLGFIWRVSDEAENEKFLNFWGRRARAYLIHPSPVSTPLYGREELGCNCLSAGEAKHVECIMPRAYKSMLGFFQMVEDVPGYYEAEIFVPEEGEGVEVEEWEGGRRGESPAAA
ncbi:hypothetical protein ACLMJK_009049 [Lecanora helva]